MLTMQNPTTQGAPMTASRDDLERFAGELRAARAVRRISQVALGEKVGVDGSTVSAWERGIRAPTRDQVFQIEDALNVSDGRLAESLGYVPRRPVGHDEEGAGSRLSLDDLSDRERNLLGFFLRILRDENGEDTSSS